jgi:3-deoxy-D-manno-octulosonic-acid transferase
VAAARSSRSATARTEARSQVLTDTEPSVGEIDRGPPPPLDHDPNPGPLRAALHLAYDLTWIVCVLVSSPWWLTRALFDREWRAMVLGRLTLDLDWLPERTGSQRVMIHGVSVGEVKAAQSLIQALRVSRPEIEIVVSTSTNTGVEVANNLYPDLSVVRFPLDSSFLIRRFLRRVAPTSVILMELEIWPNFLREANRWGVPVAVVNGRITRVSFSRYGIFKRLLPQFNRLTLVCAQDERYADRFEALSLPRERLVVTGNLKVDGLRTGPVDPGVELTRMAGVRAGQFTLVAGSTHDPEERQIVQAARKGVPDMKVILVPRHPVRTAEVTRALNQIGEKPQLLTRLRNGSEQPDPDKPLIVDTIGELEQVYGLADIVFVGGSLVPHGGQNMLEPSAQGLPVLYGPNVSNFRQEASFLEEVGAAERVANPSQLATALRRLLDDEDTRNRMARAGIESVEKQRGAAKLTFDALVVRFFQV